jgi:hypothetical protein
MKTHVLRYIVLGACLAGSLFAQESHTLAYKFAKGKTYFYRNTMDGSTTQEMMGQEMKMDQASNTLVRVVVDAVQDKSADLMISADSLVVSSKMPARDTTMSLTHLLGKRTKIRLSTLGEVMSREVIDSVTEGSMRGGVQREAMSFMMLPDGKKKVGEKWNATKTDTIEAMGGTIYNTTNIDYTITGTEKRMSRNCLKITFEGATETNGKASMMGMELFIEGTGTTKGTAYFDEAEGILIEVESTTNNESTMAATGQQQMTIPISQSMKARSVLVAK